MGANGVNFKSLKEVKLFDYDNFIVIDSKKTDRGDKILLGRIFQDLYDRISDNIDISSLIGIPSNDGYVLTGDTDGTYEWVDVNSLINISTPSLQEVLDVGSIASIERDYRLESIQSISNKKSIDYRYRDNSIISNIYALGNLDDITSNNNSLKTGLFSYYDYTNASNEKGESTIKAEYQSNNYARFKAYYYKSSNVLLPGVEMSVKTDLNELTKLEFKGNGDNLFTDDFLTGFGYSSDYRNNGISTYGNLWSPNWGSVKDFRAEVYAQPLLELTSVSNQVTIDYNASTYYNLDLNENTSISLVNFTFGSYGDSKILKVTQSGLGGFSIDFSGTGVYIPESLSEPDIQPLQNPGEVTYYHFTIFEGEIALNVLKKRDSIMISNTLPAFIKYKTCDPRPLRGGKGLSFDGVDSYINDIPLNGYDFNKGFSFGLICNIDKDAGNKRHILQYMTNGDYSLEIFGTTRGNKLTARFEDSQNVATFFNASLANIQIIESIFCVYNYIDSTIKIYVNDILLVDDSYNFVIRNLGEALGKFAYFNINTVLGDVYFLRIGSQDLTFEQFLNKERLNEDLYCYNFEEENGLVVFDASGNDNHGVIFGNVNRISNDVYSRADEVGYSLPATTNLFNINGLIGNGPRTYYFNVLGNLQVVFPRPSVNVFMAIAFGKEYNLRIDSPRQITIKHGGYGAGTVTLGQTNQDLTFTSYTNGSYALLFLNNFTQEDFNNSTINLSLVEDFIIPRDESNTDFDVLGNQLQNVGKACGANE